MIRLGSPGDASAMLEVYYPYVTGTAVTFESTLPSQEDFSKRVAGICNAYPCLVYEEDGRVRAYAYASRFREKEAYRFDAETTIYLAADLHGRRIGSALYTALLELLAAQGYRNAYAGITLPNEKSVALHERFGFRTVGIFRKSGYKLGGWHDVVWMEKALSDFPARPAETIPVDKLEPALVRDILAWASQIVPA